MNEIAAHLVLNEYVFARTVDGSHIVFDAPIDYCGVYVCAEAPGPFEAALAERGWLVLHGPCQTVIAQLESVFRRS